MDIAERRQSINGHNAAVLEQVIEEKRPRLVRQGKHSLWSRYDAEDAVQDTCVAILRSPTAVRLDTVENLLFRANHNKLIDMSRRAKTHPSISFSEKMTREPGWEPVTETLEEAVVPMVDAETVVEVVNQLAPRLRDALNLKAEGYTDEEAARSLGVPVGTYKTIVRRGRFEVKRLLDIREHPNGFR